MAAGAAVSMPSTFTNGWLGGRRWLCAKDSAASLRLGVVGGGPGSWIGQMHRNASEMDGWFRVVAGVFSSDPVRSRAAGPLLGIDAARSYGDVAEMLRAEAARSDGIDAVAIMTPNDTHYPYAAAALDAGLDVVCDKPVTHTHAQALDLVARTQAQGRIFAIAHAYSAYPMVRHARQLVREGTIGAVRLVQVEYIQSGLATRVEDGARSARLRWVLAPERSGQALVMSAIGCHAQHLACFVAGLPVTRVAADVGTLMPGRQVVDHVSALLEFAGGARGTFTVTQAAAGAAQRHPPAHLRRERPPRLVPPRCEHPRARAAGRAGAQHRPRQRVPAARHHRRRAHAARPSRRPARGLRQSLRRSGAGAHGARTGRAGA